MEKTDNHCACCGDPATKVCSRCKNTKYCSQHCQKAHWQTHRALCGTIPSQPQGKPVDHPCNVCLQPAALACDRCNNSLYCQVKCQRAERFSHSALCGSFAAFRERPHLEAKRVIYFPIERNQPEFSWVGHQGCSSNLDFLNFLPEEYQKSRSTGFRGGPNFGTLFGDDSSDLEGILISGRQEGQKIVSRNIGIVWHKQSGSDSINKAVYAITDWETLPHRWSGSVVAYGLDESGSNLEDLDTTDLQFIIQFFKRYGDEEGHLRFDPRTIKLDDEPVEKVQAVQIFCAGEQNYRDKPVFQVVNVTTTHEIFKRGKSSSIAEHIGVSLISIKVPTPNLCTRYMPNTWATFLHQSCEVKDSAFAFAAAYWQKDVGNVLVARSDQKHLSPKFLEILCAWCVTELTGPFQVALEKPHIETADEDILYDSWEDAEIALNARKMEAREAMLKNITKEKFDAFKTKWMAKTDEELVEAKADISSGRALDFKPTPEQLAEFEARFSSLQMN